MRVSIAMYNIRTKGWNSKWFNRNKPHIAVHISENARKHKQHNERKRRSSEHFQIYDISLSENLCWTKGWHLQIYAFAILTQCVSASSRVSSFSLLWQILQTDLYEGNMYNIYIHHTYMHISLRSFLCL